jgi:hypothetical protein
VAPDAQAGAEFGLSVALSNDHAIVGAYTETWGVEPLGAAGAAYVFARTGTNSWDAGTRLVASDAQANDRFGRSVALSGDLAIVGAYLEDGGADDPLDRAGAAYVFHYDGSDWDAGTKLVAPDAQELDGFGESVALSGTYAIVGASAEDGGAGDPRSGAGAAYVFQYDGATWDAGTKLVAPDAQADDAFGYSVALSGGHAIVGASGEDGGADNPLIGAGAAYVFEL